MDISNIIAIAISVLALILSGITFWNDSLKPFRLSVVNAGRVESAMNPYRAPSKEPALMAELIFANQGARAGAVRDVALRVTFPGGERVLYRTIAVSIDQRQQLGKELGQPELESFVGFHINGRESVVKHIVFVLMQPDQYSDFALGPYIADVLVRTSTNDQWEEKDKFTFTVDKGDVDVLSKTRFQLEPDGRYFVNWPRQSKVTQEGESALNQLKVTLGR